MSNIITINTLDVATRLTQILVRKNVTVTPRITVDGNSLEIAFHLNGDTESDSRDIALISEVLDLGLTPSTAKGVHWASDMQEIRGVAVETTIFSEVFRATGKTTLSAVK